MATYPNLQWALALHGSKRAEACKYFALGIFADGTRHQKNNYAKIKKKEKEMKMKMRRGG